MAHIISGSLYPCQWVLLNFFYFFLSLRMFANYRPFMIYYKTMSAAIVAIFVAVPCALGVWLWWSMRKIGGKRTAYSSRKAQRPPQTFGKIPEASARVDRVERPPRDISSAMQAVRSFVSSGPTFAAIDFETANSRYYSACSLGVVLFENGKIAKRNLYMINPDCNFAPENVAIHGITRAQVADAPKFDALWPELVPIFRKFRVVAYSDFDAKVLRSLIRHYGLTVEDSFTLNYFDVCQCARDNILGLTNYKLPTVAEFLNIEGLKHHDAVSDAETCGKIYVRLIAQRGRKIRASMDIPATYAQQDYIRNLGGKVPPTLSKAGASKLITELIEQQKREAEEAVATRRRGKEEAELQFMAAAMRAPGYKLAKRGAKRTQDLRELQYLVSKVIADDVIEPREMLEIQAWLEEHKILPTDFSHTLRLISDLLKYGKSGKVAEMKDLYSGLLDCLNELRRRPTM